MVGLATEEDRGICCTPFHRLRSFSINKLRQEQCKFNVVKLSYHAEICAYPYPTPPSTPLNKQCSPRGQRQCCWGCSHMSDRSRRNTTRGGSTAPPRPPHRMQTYLYFYMHTYTYICILHEGGMAYLFQDNAGKQQRQKKGTNFRLLPFVPFLSAESVNPGRARQDSCSMHMKPGYYRLQYYTPSPCLYPPSPLICAYITAGHL